MVRKLKNFLIKYYGSYIVQNIKRNSLEKEISTELRKKWNSLVKQSPKDFEYILELTKTLIELVKYTTWSEETKKDIIKELLKNIEWYQRNLEEDEPFYRNDFEFYSDMFDDSKYW